MAGRRKSAHAAHLERHNAATTMHISAYGHQTKHQPGRQFSDPKVNSNDKHVPGRPSAGFNSRNRALTLAFCFSVMLRVDGGTLGAAGAGCSSVDLDRTSPDLEPWIVASLGGEDTAGPRALRKPRDHGDSGVP